MLEQEFIKIEPEDIEQEAENVSHNQQQQIKDEDDLLNIKVEDAEELVTAEVKVAELETAEEAHINYNTKKYSENKNERNCENVPTSRRQNDNSSCSKNSTEGSDNVDTNPCCNICALYMEQTIVLNCKFCNLNYSDVGNTKSDIQKMFHLIEDISQENPLQKSLVSLPQTNCDELLDYCGNILKLKHREFFIVCGSSEIEYAMDLFERHVPHHEIFEQSRIKSELSRETIDTTETYGDTTKLPKLMKLEKETVIDTIQPSPSTIFNKFHEKDSARTDLKADFLKALTQKTTIVLEESCLEDQSSRDQIKEECIVEESMIQEESCFEDQSSRDQIKEECMVEESIIQEKSCFEDQSSRDQIKEKCIAEEQSILEPFHEDQFQQSIKQFNCTLCRLPFLNEKDVSLHMPHCVDRPFKCAECFKGFKLKADLKIHFRVHTGEKPYICDICNTSFKTTSALSGHKMIHLGEAVKKHECEYCGRKFIRKNNCTAHIRLHTGEKPYACDICQRGFVSNYKLNFHLGKHHFLPSRKN